MIPDVFAQLELSGDLCEMKYQPGNAYNEDMINAAKNTGKNIFADLDPDARKNKINEHVSFFIHYCSLPSAFSVFSKYK